MNKLAKGALATGIATALFIGGGTTLALWNHSADISTSKDIDTGVLSITADTGSWSSDPTLWVPGDKIEYTTNISIIATGENLLSQLTIDSSSITGDTDLVNALETSISVSNVSGGTIVAASGNSALYDVTPADLTDGTPITAKVTVTVDFPKNSVTNQIAQGESASITGLKLMLNQIRS